MNVVGNGFVLVFFLAIALTVSVKREFWSVAVVLTEEAGIVGYLAIAVRSPVRVGARQSFAW